ncbi:gluconate transporter, partial [Rhodococcus erythropolis]|nr:gluconate transporter [Rhodococcus erythropolis]
MNTTALLAAEVVPAGSDARLIIAAVAGVAVIIALITWLDLHPFLALSIGAVGVGLAAGLGSAESV